MMIDLNADAGESFGRWQLGDDRALFSELTSVNLACGFHAGDPLTIQRTVQLAGQAGVALGAHPSFPDLAGFGRRDMALSSNELYASVIYQLGALAAFLRLEGLSLHHVKPHGALYLQMARNAETARVVAASVKDFDTTLPLVILAGAGGTVMAEQAHAVGTPVVLEAFPDRAYLASGHLAPRTLPGSVLHDPEQIAARALQMVCDGRIDTLDGGEISLNPQTLCIHGDNPQALANAQTVRTALEAAGVTLRPF
jgi:UPF0271 protein